MRCVYHHVDQPLCLADPPKTIQPVLCDGMAERPGSKDKVEVA